MVLQFVEENLLSCQNKVSTLKKNIKHIRSNLKEKYKREVSLSLFSNKTN